jgi:hypothetical protein
VLLYGDYPSESECTDLIYDARYVHINVTIRVQNLSKYFHFSCNYFFLISNFRLQSLLNNLVNYFGMT